MMRHFISFEASLRSILVNELAYSSFNYRLDKGQYGYVCMYHKDYKVINFMVHNYSMKDLKSSNHLKFQSLPAFLVLISISYIGIYFFCM